MLKILIETTGKLLGTEWKVCGIQHVIAWRLHCGCLEAARRLPGSCAETAWKLQADCTEAAWALHGNCPETP